MKLPRKTEEVRFHFKHKNSNAFDASRGFRKQGGREDATQRPISTLGSFLLSYRHPVSGIKSRPRVQNS